MKDVVLNDCKKMLSVIGLGVTAAITLRTIVLVAAARSDFINLDSYFVQMLLIILTSFAIPYLSLYLFQRKANLSSVTTEKPPLYYVLPLTIALFPLAFAGSVLIEALAALFGFSVEQNVYEYVLPTDTVETIIFILVMAVIAPIFEELIFRGLILKPLRKLGDITAIVLSSLFFSLFHGNFTQIIYAFLCGLLLGYTATVFGSVKASAIIHVLYNLITILLFDLSGINGLAADIINYTLILSGTGVFIYMILKKVGAAHLKASPFGKKEVIITIISEPTIIISFVILVYFCSI